MLLHFVKRSFVALAIAVVPMGASAQSLADALAYAYDNSDLLDQQRFLLRAEDEDVAIAISALRPTMDYFATLNNTVSRRGTLGPFDSLTMTLGLQLDWTLYASGRNLSQIEAAKYTVLAARQGLISAEQNVLLNAVTAYMQLREDRETLRLRESNLRLIAQELRAAQDRFEVGEVTRTDVSIAEARLASARSSVAAARGQVEISRQGYILAIGREPGALAAPPALPALPQTAQEAEAIALRSHPSVARLQNLVKANEFQAQAAEQGRGSSITMRGRYQADTTSGAPSGIAGVNQDRSISLTYSQPIYAGGQLLALSRRAQASLHASRSELAQQGRVVSDAVGRAWAELTVAQAVRAASAEQIRAAQLAFDGTREEASLGARTTLDVLNAEQELLDARTQALAAETRAYVAVYGVLFSMGLLTTDHLGLSVQRYDPQAYYDVVSKAPTFVNKNMADLDRVLKRIGADK